jgi:predicted nucleic acid-binding protein
MLTDAGPLLAILDRGDPHHQACMSAARSLGRTPLLTTWPCLTEAMHLLGRAGGYRLQSGLWNLRAAGRLVVHDLTEAETDRAAVLMQRYQDTPMDLGDASLVAVAESRASRQIFTLDRHFWIYRLTDGSALDPIPARTGD